MDECKQKNRSRNRANSKGICVSVAADAVIIVGFVFFGLFMIWCCARRIQVQRELRALVVEERRLLALAEQERAAEAKRKRDKAQLQKDVQRAISLDGHIRRGSIVVGTGGVGVPPGGGGAAAAGGSPDRRGSVASVAPGGAIRRGSIAGADIAPPLSREERDMIARRSHRARHDRGSIGSEDAMRAVRMYDDHDDGDDDHAADGGGTGEAAAGMSEEQIRKMKARRQRARRRRSRMKDEVGEGRGSGRGRSHRGRSHSHTHHGGGGGRSYRSHGSVRNLKAKIAQERARQRELLQAQISMRSRRRWQSSATAVLASVRGPRASPSLAPIDSFVGRELDDEESAYNAVQFAEEREREAQRASVMRRLEQRRRSVPENEAEVASTQTAVTIADNQRRDTVMR